MTSSYDAPPTMAEPTPVSAPPFERIDYESGSLEDSRQFLENVYSGRQFRARRSSHPFSFRFAAAGDARLSLETGHFRGSIQGVIPWSRDYVMSWFRSGSVTIDYPAGQLTSVGSRPFLTPTETSFAFAMTPHQHSIVSIDADFLEAIATERHSGPAQRVVFEYGAEPTSHDWEAWRATLRTATPLVVNESTAPLVRHQAQASLVRAMLDLFPWRAVDVPDAIRTERTRKLRVAVEYVHEHANEAITSADVAAAAGLHTRTLQTLMVGHLNCSPMNYLRSVRLDRVRQDLLSADPAVAKVLDIARLWGFGNLGRFAASYAARFGEYPRDTLNR